MGKLNFLGRFMTDDIPKEKDELIKQNARLRLQNEFLRCLLECHRIIIPESMDDFLETKEMGISEEAYIVEKLDVISTKLSMMNQLLIDIKVNMD